ncbi:uncharacterized protein B0I36DRAFT_251094 [Microdochium trichocladiopsis]|uniref:DUF7730 domain-containing protein n=1 Tax=Microdochium trichocladiopsis TaxID=1682393 RepID=A0A9P8Y089_9PEZI|nr:uncharacterized protein B0I36DRAFT_251094 [Microdochium trichocladiopsis]KAH7025305.1 hypothetical protein B0I36DRAFT_251094 [Microdochium trichocladiopsis]
MPSTSAGFKFLALPLEIRQQIYRLCVPQNLLIGSESVEREFARFENFVHYDDSNKEVVHGLDNCCRASDAACPPRFTNPRRRAIPGLLLVSRQVSAEAQIAMYAGNTFQFFLNGAMAAHSGDGIAKFYPETRAKMRKLILFTGAPFCYLNFPNISPRYDIWDDALKNISVLGVVALPPHYSRGRFWAAEETKHVEMKDIVHYLSGVLPRTARIVVDADRYGDTVQIWEEGLPGRCHFQRLRAGDMGFGRGFYPTADSDSDSE